MDRRTQWVFLIAAVLGAALPLWAFAPFLVANGLNLSLFFKQLWQTPVSRFFALDVLVSAATFWLFMVREGRRLRMKHLWAYCVCTLVVGVSLGLPLFLLYRERKMSVDASLR
jgi:Protein of unknown function DUF2834